MVLQEDKTPEGQWGFGGTGFFDTQTWNDPKIELFTCSSSQSTLMATDLFVGGWGMVITGSLPSSPYTVGMNRYRGRREVALPPGLQSQPGQLSHLPRQSSVCSQFSCPEASQGSLYTGNKDQTPWPGTQGPWRRGTKEAGGWRGSRGL